jgi:hypothetical protein
MGAICDVNVMCGQNTKFINLKPCGTYSDHRPYRGRESYIFNPLAPEFSFKF